MDVSLAMQSSASFMEPKVMNSVIVILSIFATQWQVLHLFSQAEGDFDIGKRSMKLGEVLQSM